MLCGAPLHLGHRFEAGTKQLDHFRSQNAPSDYSLEGLVEGDGTSFDLSRLYERFTNGQPLDAFIEEFPETMRQFLQDAQRFSLPSVAQGSLDVIPYTKADRKRATFG